MALRKRLAGLIAAISLLPLGASASIPAAAHAATALHELAASHAPDGGFTPQDITQAYDASSLLDQGVDGTGEKVALIELGGVQNSDISQFDARFGLPTPSVSTYYAGNKAFSISVDPEATLDLEWLHAMAPGAG